MLDPIPCPHCQGYALHQEGCPSFASLGSAAEPMTLEELTTQFKEIQQFVRREFEAAPRREPIDGNRGVQPGDATITEVHRRGLEIIASGDSDARRLHKLWDVILDARYRANNTGRQKETDDTKAG